MNAFLAPVKRRKAPLQKGEVFFSVGRESWVRERERGWEIDMGRGREVEVVEEVERVRAEGEREEAIEGARDGVREAVRSIGWRGRDCGGGG